jgi:DNA polymerase III subunit epsilon
VPLSFAPGEAYQSDWSHEVVLTAGATVTVKVAISGSATAGCYSCGLRLFGGGRTCALNQLGREPGSRASSPACQPISPSTARRSHCIGGSAKTGRLHLAECGRMTRQERRGTNMRPILFLDFEASSLSPASWPIEIGWSVLREGEIRTASSLIRPRASWTDWSEVSARIHGIRLEDLHAAPEADMVAARTDAFRSYQVVSDNAAWEQRWLDRLREGRPRILVEDLHDVAPARITPRGLDWMYERLERRRAPHRAGPDSRRLAEAYFYGARRG